MNIYYFNSKLKGWRNSHPFLVIVILIALQIIVFYMLYYKPALQSSVFAPMLNMYAHISSQVLNLFGYQTSVFNGTIQSPLFSVNILKGCDALEPMALVAAGIIAFPASVKQKLYGLFIGLTFLFVLNIIRIISLFLIGIYFPDWFETMHVDVWQIVFILSGIAFWFFWIRWTVKNSKPS